MISKIAWDNVAFLNIAVIDKMSLLGGKMIAVESFRPYFSREWVLQIDSKTARREFLKEIETWCKGVQKRRLTKRIKLRGWNENLTIARLDVRYSKQMWFLLKCHYNLYSLATYRRTIEELATSAYAYCDKKTSHSKAQDRESLRDFRRLIRLSKSFLLSEWVHDMVERAVSNGDSDFFDVLSHSLRKDLMVNPTVPAREWLLVVLLWYMGGNTYGSRREFLHELHQHGILPRSVSEANLNAELRRFGLTVSYS